MRLLVTGANGQIGWELKRSLAPLGDVVALDRAACDFMHPTDVSSTIRALEPDIIVNAAAYTAVDRAESEELVATLINGTTVGAIAKTARSLDALLIHYSTDYVFDGTKGTPYNEDDVPNPVNAYGRSKLAGERAIVSSASDYLIFRTAWIYAARGHNFLRTVIRLAREREELRIVDDQIGAPTWAREIGEATARIVGRACEERAQGHFTSGIFNMTAAGAVSWHGFARAILDQAMSGGILRKGPQIHPTASADYPTPAKRPRNSRLASERLQQRFGVTLADWREGLARCMQDESLIAVS